MYHIISHPKISNCAKSSCMIPTANVEISNGFTFQLIFVPRQIIWLTGNDKTGWSLIDVQEYAIQLSGDWLRLTLNHVQVNCIRPYKTLQIILCHNCGGRMRNYPGHVCFSFSDKLQTGQQQHLTYHPYIKTRLFYFYIIITLWQNNFWSID